MSIRLKPAFLSLRSLGSPSHIVNFLVDRLTHPRPDQLARTADQLARTADQLARTADQTGCYISYAPLAPSRPSYAPLASPWPSYAPLVPSRPSYAPLVPSRPSYAPLVPSRPSYAPLVPSRPNYAPLVPSRPSYAPLVPSRPSYAPLVPSRPSYAPLVPSRPNYAPLAPGLCVMLSRPCAPAGLYLSCFPGHAPPHACICHASQAMRPRMPVIDQNAEGCYTDGSSVQSSTRGTFYCAAAIPSTASSMPGHLLQPVRATLQPYNL